MTRSLKLACAAGLVVATVSTAPSIAQERSQPNPWLDCGIGAMIFPGDNVEAAAGISNIIWDLGTTAVTSAASSPDSCTGLNAQSAQFIGNSYAQLEVEIAQGEGEHLETLAALMGCGDASSDAYLRRVRARSGELFTAAGYADLSYEEKAASFYLVVEDVAAAEFAETCVVA